MSQKNQTSETFTLGLILAAVGGFLDAYTYICRGGVFANAQTGNIVLFGIQISQLNFSQALRYLIPILAFILGVVTSEIIKNRFKFNKKFHWRQIIILGELLVLSIVSYLPQTSDFNMLANVLVSFVCSLQVQSFKKINGNAFATTMCTGNLRSATELFCKSVAVKDKSQSLCLLQNGLQYFAVIMAFIIGATLGAVLTTVFAVSALFAACIALVVVFFLMFFEHL